MVNNAPTSQQLIAQLRSQGLSVREIAGELDRDSSIVYQVAAGKKSGEAYRQTLAELATRGHVSHRPPRRQRRDGTFAKVRGRAGQTGHQPPPTRAVPRRGQFGTETAYRPDGSRLHHVQAPKTPGKGRGQASDAVLDQMRSAAKGRRRVSFTVTSADGRVVGIGGKYGYRSSDVLSRMNDHNGISDPLGWLGSEAQKIYAEIDGKIVNIQVNVSGQQTPASATAHYLGR